MEKKFRVGDWMVRPELNTLESAEGQVRIEPRAMQVLVFLAEHSGQVVAKEQLIESVWAGASVTDEALTYAVCGLRRPWAITARILDSSRPSPRKATD